MLVQLQSHNILLAGPTQVNTTLSGSNLYAFVAAARYTDKTVQVYNKTSVLALWSTATIQSVATCATCGGWVTDAYSFNQLRPSMKRQRTLFCLTRAYWHGRGSDYDLTKCITSCCFSNPAVTTGMASRKSHYRYISRHRLVSGAPPAPAGWTACPTPPATLGAPPATRPIPKRQKQAYVPHVSRWNRPDASTRQIIVARARKKATPPIRATRLIMEKLHLIAGECKR